MRKKYRKIPPPYHLVPSTPDPAIALRAALRDTKRLKEIEASFIEACDYFEKLRFGGRDVQGTTGSHQKADAEDPPFCGKMSIITFAAPLQGSLTKSADTHLRRVKELLISTEENLEKATEYSRKRVGSVSWSLWSKERVETEAESKVKGAMKSLIASEVATETSSAVETDSSLGSGFLSLGLKQRISKYLSVAEPEVNELVVLRRQALHGLMQHHLHIALASEHSQTNPSLRSDDEWKSFLAARTEYQDFSREYGTGFRTSDGEEVGEELYCEVLNWDRKQGDDKVVCDDKHHRTWRESYSDMTLNDVKGAE